MTARELRGLGREACTWKYISSVEGSKPNVVPRKYLKEVDVIKQCMSIAQDGEVSRRRSPNLRRCYDISATLMAAPQTEAQDIARSGSSDLDILGVHDAAYC